MRKILLQLIFWITLFPASVWAEPWVLEWTSVPSTRELSATARGCGLKELPQALGNGPLSRFYRIETCRAEFLAQLKQRLASVEAVAVGTPLGLETPRQAQPIGRDPLSRFQWYLTHQGHSVRRDLSDIQSVVVSGAGVKPLFTKAGVNSSDGVIVALVDSGVDLDHPELKQSLFLNDVECQEGRLRPNPSDDRDQNGFAGDCMGWNFATEQKRDQSRPYDNDGHGTHLAGLLAARADNDFGISVLSPGIRILPVKVFDAGSRTRGVFSDRVAQGIAYAVSRGAQIINLSLGWPLSQSTRHVQVVIEDALAKGVLIVAAAGNNNSEAPLYPCAYEGVICVGALGIDGKKAPFSNFGPHVDILVPGEQILSTIPLKLDPDHFSVQGFDYKSGSSQSTALASAFLASLVAKEPLDAAKRQLYFRRELLRRTQPQEGALMGALWTQASVDHQQQLTWVPQAKRLLPVLFDTQAELSIPFVNLATGSVGCPDGVRLGDRLSGNCHWDFQIDQESPARNRAVLNWGSGFQTSWVWEWQRSIESVPHERFGLPDGVQTLRSVSVPKWYQGPQRLLGFGADSSTAQLLELSVDSIRTQAALSIPAKVDRWVAAHHLPPTLTHSDLIVAMTQETHSTGRWIGYTFWSLDGKLVDRWLYRPDVLTPPSLDRLVWVASSESGSVGRLPVFMADGSEPAGCASNDPWESSLPKDGRWLIQLQPDKSTVPTLTTRCLRVPTEEPGEWVALHAQSQEDFEAATYRAMFSTLVSPRQFYEFSPGGHKPMSTSIPEGFVRLGLRSIGAALHGIEVFSGRALSWFNGSDARTLHFRMPESVFENILHVSTVSGGNTPSLYAQSESQFWRIVWTDQGTRWESLPLDRVSFVSGQVFRETIHWLSEPEQDVFFVDASALSAPSVYWIEAPRSLVADTPILNKRARRQLAVPKGCLALNPPYIYGQNHIAFHCSSDENRLYLIDPKRF
jgi:subtilisin family serine protease